MPERRTLAEVWPLFGLTIRTPRLELRMPTDTEIVELARLAARGVHDEAFMHLAFPWELVESPQLERNMLQHHWRPRSEWKPERWQLCLGVYRDGAPIGCQDLSATDFPTLRRVTTGSWLGREHHGRGFGTEMRMAVLQLAFDGLGADRASTSYVRGNTPSQRVSEKAGYLPNGTKFRVVNGERRDEDFLLLERDHWITTRRDDIEFVGLEPCLPLLGAGTADAPA